MKTLTIQLDEYGKRTVTLRVPELSDVEDLKEGDIAPDCFGGLGMVTRIHAHGVDINGMEFVCYYVAFPNRQPGDKSLGCSSSMKRGELMRTVAATTAFLSADLDTAEACVAGGLPLPPRLARGSVRDEMRCAGRTVWP